MRRSFLLQAGNRAVIEGSDDPAGADGEPVERRLGVKLLLPNDLTVLQSDRSNETTVLFLVKDGKIRIWQEEFFGEIFIEPVNSED